MISFKTKCHGNFRRVTSSGLKGSGRLLGGDDIRLDLDGGMGVIKGEETKEKAISRQEEQRMLSKITQSTKTTCGRVSDPAFLNAGRR